MLTSETIVLTSETIVLTSETTVLKKRRVPPSPALVCYLVGAGPGDVDLLTLRATELLKCADAVIYDKLAPREALDYAPPDALRICVTQLSWTAPAQKKITPSPPPAKDVSELLIRVATYLRKKFPRQAKTKSKSKDPVITLPRTLVRLKGGDPFVFARAYEELQALVRAKIPFEVVPGITSFHAAAAHAGVPLTQRGSAQTFSVITGHFSAQDEKSKRRVIAASDTVIYLMGVKNLKRIVSENILAGEDPQTPVVIVEQATTANERIRSATLASLPHIHERDPIFHPAILLIGPTAAHFAKFAWRHGPYSHGFHRQLAGARIVLLRPLHDFPDLTKRLRKLGAHPTPIALLTEHPITGHEKKLIAALRSQTFKFLIFTSKRTVARFFTLLHEHQLDARLLYGLAIVVIGRGTAAALLSYGLHADHLIADSSDQASQEGIQKFLANHQAEPIILPQSLNARPKLVSWLERRGSPFAVFPLYTTRMVRLKQRPWIEASQTFLKGTFVYITSETALQAFTNFLLPLAPYLKKIPVTAPRKNSFPPASTWALPTVISMGERLHALTKKELKPIYASLLRVFSQKLPSKLPAAHHGRSHSSVDYFAAAAQPVDFSVLIEKTVEHYQGGPQQSLPKKSS